MRVVDAGGLCRHIETRPVGDEQLARDDLLTGQDECAAALVDRYPCALINEALLGARTDAADDEANLGRIPGGRVLVPVDAVNAHFRFLDGLELPEECLVSSADRFRRCRSPPA